MSSEKVQEPNRLILADYLKGICIVFVLIFHGLGFAVIGDVNQTVDTLPPLLFLISYPLGIMGTWAGFFFLTSGLLNSYIIYQKLKQNIKPGKIFVSNLISNLGILIMHYIFVIFFINTPPHFGYRSILTGSLEHGAFSWEFSIELLFFNTALSVIALNGILTTCFVLMIWILRRKRLDREVYLFFAVIGFVIIAIAPYMSKVVNPLMEDFRDSGRMILATLSAWVAGPRFSIFPFLAYSLYGAIFGIAIAKNESWRFIRNIGFNLGLLYFIGSVIAIFNFGFPDYNVPIPNALTLNLLDISLMLLILTIGIKIFEFKDKDQKINLANKTIGIRKYGMFTLSIFVFDPLIGALVALFFGSLFPGSINNILFGILIFLPVLMLVWWLILRYWEKINFKYTVEWILGRIMEKLRGYKSDKMQFIKNIYTPYPQQKNEKVPVNDINNQSIS